MPTKQQIFRSAVIAKRGRYCMYCGVGPLQKRALHIVPLSAADMGNPCRMTVSCATCAARRGDTDVVAFVQSRIPQVELELTILRALAERFR